MMLPIPGLGNPLLQGGAVLMLLGGLLATLRSIPDRIVRFVSARMFVSCMIDNEDSIYYWVSVWLASRPEMQRTGALRVVSSWDGTSGRSAVLSPGDGEHTIRYHGTRLWVSVSSESPGQMATTRPRTIKIRCWLKYRPQLEQLLSDVTEHERNPDPSLTRLFVADGGCWTQHSTRPARPRESIVLDDGLYDQITQDAQRFLASRSEYLSLGIPHRRGYMLSGPPGNGKSSLALALAASLSAPLYSLSLGDPGMSDDRLLRLLGSVPSGGVVVAEDVDTIFNGREREAENKLTLSGLLNALDGPLASEGRILVLTSNRPEVLDPALVRPGRVDLSVVLENANPEQARQMWRRFHGEPGADAFALWAGDGSHSMADLQAHLLTANSGSAEIRPCKMVAA